MAPRPGVKKASRRIGTRARVRDAEARKKRLNNLQAQSNEIITKEALEGQIKEIEERFQNPEITNYAENEVQLKALFNELNQLTEKEDAIQAQIKVADEEQRGSEMDVDDVDQGVGSDPPDFAQTREDNVPVDDSDENSTPENYADILPVNKIDSTGDDDEAEGWGLDGGTTLAMSKIGKRPIYLNSYGYKSCAITVWEKEEAERTVDNLTKIHGNPHKKAMETNEEGDYIHRGKIKRILNVAWEPKGKIQSMEDLLASVEELNPQKKAGDAEYRYPFSTVLVEWTDGLERTWISRTNYKTLSSQSKASNKRTDRKFYQTGLLQVKRYREYLWGDSRSLGNLERTPPGLTESPEPGESNATRGDTASHQANNNMQRRGEPDGVGQFGQVQGSQNEGGRTSPRRQGPANQSPANQSPSSQNAGSQNAGSQNAGSQNAGSQNAGSQNAGSQGQASQQQENHGNKPRTMSNFYAEWLRENNLDANTEVRTLEDELFGRFRAAAHAYADEYERKVGQQLQDDMGILKR